MVTIKMTDQEAAIVIRDLETGHASGGERRFVLIPIIENIKFQMRDAGYVKESSNLATQMQSSPHVAQNGQEST